MRIAKIYLAGLYVGLGIIAPWFSHASGIAISPAKIEVYVSQGLPGQAVFYVSNPDPEIQIFEIYLDELAKYAEITPQIFSLNPGGSKQVSLKIFPEALKQKQLANSYVSIVGRPLSDSNLQIASGVKLALEIVDATPTKGWPSKKIFTGLAALGSLLAAAAWQKIKS